jgi:hypothetical protein
MWMTYGQAIYGLVPAHVTSVTIVEANGSTRHALTHTGTYSSVLTSSPVRIVLASHAGDVTVYRPVHR